MGSGGSRRTDGLYSQEEAAFERPAWAQASTLKDTGLILQIEDVTLSALPHKDPDTSESVPLALLRPLLTFTDFCLNQKPFSVVWRGQKSPPIALETLFSLKITRLP